MNGPIKLTCADIIYLKFMSRKYKSARSFVSYLEKFDRRELVSIRDRLSMESRGAPSKLLKLYCRVFSNFDTELVEHQIYLAAEYELYYRDCQSARI